MERSGHMLDGAKLLPPKTHRVRDALHTVLPGIVQSPEEYYDGRSRTDHRIRVASGKVLNLSGIVPSAEGVRYFGSKLPLPDQD